MIFTMDRDGTDVRFLAQGYLSEAGYTTMAIRSRVRRTRSWRRSIPETCSNGVGGSAAGGSTPGWWKTARLLVRSRDALGPRVLTSGWTTDKPVAQWPGVARRHGDPSRVRGLEFRRDVVTGTLPPDIDDLTMLENLELYRNILLVGPIPPELGNLTTLRTLIVADNNLSGPIPPELGKLTILKRLVLSNNDLSGPIPPELGNLKRLRNLRLPHYRLSGCVPVELSDMWVEATGFGAMQTVTRGGFAPCLPLFGRGPNLGR